MKKIVFIVVICLIIFPNKALAQGINDDIINEQLNMLDFGELNTALENSNKNLNFKDLITKAMKGKLELSPKSIFETIMNTLFEELHENNVIIRNLIVICILSALIKNLTGSFKSKEVGELGFYISYIILVIVLFNSFNIAVNIMKDLINELSYIMQATLPLVMSLVIMSGYVTTAFVFDPLVLFFINFITIITRDFIAPMILLTAVMQIVNYISEKVILKKLTIFIQKSIGWVLKCTAILFITILSLQRISTPIVNNLITKTAKISINAIPLVGNVLTGAVDTVMYWASATKSGFVVAALISILIVCSLPIIKLVALMLVYKIIASIIEPICDERIVECIDSIGSFTALILGAVVTVIVMFVFYIMIILSF